MKTKLNKNEINKLLKFYKITSKFGSYYTIPKYGYHLTLFGMGDMVDGEVLKYENFDLEFEYREQKLKCFYSK